VLTIFGGVVHVQQWQTRLQQTDAELHRAAGDLASRVRGLFPIPRMPGPGPRPPWQERRDGASRPSGDDRNGGEPTSPQLRTVEPSDPQVAQTQPSEPLLSPPRTSDEPGMTPRNPVRDRGPDGGRDRERGRGGPWEPRQSPRFLPPPGLGLPEDFKQRFEGDEESSFYFVIWDRNGTVLEKSKSVDEIPFPGLHNDPNGLPIRTVRTRDQHREVIQVTRFDLNVLVGRSLHPDFVALGRSDVLLGLTGAGVLAIGLIGGWWFSSRAIRPISEMSAIAESISAKNLSSRISAESTATELEQLATVLNRTFDRLQSAFERQGQFTADASHELRTPVTVILSQAELALSRPRTSEEYQSALDACRRAALRMKTLIDSMLLLARFDSGQPVKVAGSVELDRVALEAIEMLRPLADERQIEIASRTQAVAVIADREQIFRVLTNLLTNAIRYNRPDGKIDVEVTAERGQAIVRVSDTGIGIPAADLPLIFDRFYRVDKARSRAEGSCGLGLAICQAIVESHGGTISATSEPDVGTTIEVRWPHASRPSLADTVEMPAISNVESAAPAATAS
jgi:two-component system, OmpR family, sensor kinase